MENESEPEVRGVGRSHSLGGSFRDRHEHMRRRDALLQLLDAETTLLLSLTRFHGNPLSVNGLRYIESGICPGAQAERQAGPVRHRFVARTSGLRTSEGSFGLPRNYRPRTPECDHKHLIFLSPVSGRSRPAAQAPGAEKEHGSHA